MSAGLHPQVRALLEVALARRATSPARPTSRPSAPPTCRPRSSSAGRWRRSRASRTSSSPTSRAVACGRAPTGRPSPPSRSASFVWLHGGGWYVGDIESFDRVTRQLANASGAVCLSVEYRLAPEHPYPARGAGRARRGRLGGRRRRAAAGHRPGPRGRSAATAPAATSRRSPPATSAARCARSCSSTRPSTPRWTATPTASSPTGPMLRARGHGALLGPLPRRRGPRASPTLAAERRRPRAASRRPTSRSPATTSCATTACATPRRCAPPAST